MTAVAAAIYLALALSTGLGMGWLTALDVPGSVVSFLSLTTDLAIRAIVLGDVAGLGAHVDTDLALLHGAGVLVAAALVVRGLAGTLRGRDPIASLAAGMAALALLAVQTQPWYLLWALAPAAATDRPRLQALLGWGCVVLAMLVPPTGGDFLHRGYGSSTPSRPPLCCSSPGQESTGSIGCAVQALLPQRGNGSQAGDDKVDNTGARQKACRRSGSGSAPHAGR